MSLDHMRDEWEHCDKCELSTTRTKVAFGKGNPYADILIIGEGPGAEEDSMGDPYVGPEGDELHIFLEGSALDWKEDTYITNLVGCQPFVVVKKRDKHVKENRPPSRVEKDACWPRLFEIIYRVDPLLIITLGKTAANAVLTNTGTMSSLQGRVHTCILQGRYTEIRYPVLAMYCPSYLLRNPAGKNASEGPWQDTYENFGEATDILDHLRNCYWGIEAPNRGD